MDISAVAPVLARDGLSASQGDPVGTDPAQAAEVARQFETILLRQVLSESMKPLLQDGPAGQVYGYFLTDSLADSVSRGGGLGLAHILQTQLEKGPIE